MKEALKNNKKVLIIGGAIILILLLGLTFAYLVTTISGEKEYIVRAGSLNLILTENNELTLESLKPEEDSVGMSFEGFTFSLENKGGIETDYTIYLDDLELAEGETRIPDSALRYSLEKNEVVGDPSNLTSMGSNLNRIVDSGSLAVNEKNTYTLKIWIDYDATVNDASGKVFKAKLRVVASQAKGEPVSEVVLANVGENGSTYDDGTDTFITGTDPNNYIWYSGKLWRAVSVNNEAGTTKLVTQWNISTIAYNVSGNGAFAGSYMEEWLNDTTVDGFLGNLRDYEDFIVTDAKWNATLSSSSLKPAETTLVTDAVGLLNYYEYGTSYRGASSSTGYLNNGIQWWTLTPYDASYIWNVNRTGYASHVNTSSTSYGVRPSINLKSNVKIVDGDGTIDNPYRLKGDNDISLSGTLLNTRYSGEYIRFGNDENNLYQIISHENGTGTKIVSSEPLKSSGIFINSTFGSDLTFSIENTIGSFLNGEYLTNYVDSIYSDMIEESTTWYLGMLGDVGLTSYKYAKYTDATGTSITSSVATAKVGLLRYGELMSGQFDEYSNNNEYWLLTPYPSYYVWRISTDGDGYRYTPSNTSFGIRPAMNLKSNVIITGGDGTKENPFTLSVQ